MMKASNDQIISYSNDNEIKIWGKNGINFATMKAPFGTPGKLLDMNDNEFISTSFSKITVWNKNGTLIRSLDHNKHDITKMIKL